MILRHPRRAFCAGGCLIISIAMLSFASPGFAETATAPQVLAIAGTEALESVACHGASFCVAVGSVPFGDTYPGSEGVVVPIVDGTPGTPEAVPGTVGFSGVSCPSATTCIAVGFNDVPFMGSSPIFAVGEVVTITSGVPGPPQEAPPGEVGTIGSPNELMLTAVSCTSTTSCMSVSFDDTYYGVIVPIRNGNPLPEEAFSGGGENQVTGVACPSKCLAVGSWSLFAKYGALAMAIPHQKPGPLTEYSKKYSFYDVACLNNITSCTAIGQIPDAGVVTPIGKTTTPARHVMEGTYPNAITCVNEVYCAVVGQNSSEGAIVSIFDDVPAKADIVSAAQTLTGVACYSSTSCLAVGNNSTEGVLVKFHADS